MKLKHYLNRLLKLTTTYGEGFYCVENEEDDHHPLVKYPQFAYEYDFIIQFDKFDDNGFLKEQHYDEYFDLDTYDVPSYTMLTTYYCGCSKELIYSITKVKRVWSLKTISLTVLASIQLKNLGFLAQHKKKYKDVLLELYYRPGRGIGYMNSQKNFILLQNQTPKEFLWGS